MTILDTLTNCASVTLRLLIPFLFGTFALPVHAEVIEGFRDLKFGMTKTAVGELEACSTPSECLYELAGKNRYLHTLYIPEQGTIQSGSPTASTSYPETLARITIDMGAFTDNWYQELQVRLGDKYTLTHDLTENAKTMFRTNQTSELVSGYENGEVLLKVVRRQFGNLTLKVIYQTKRLAAESIKELETSQ